MNAFPALRFLSSFNLVLLLLTCLSATSVTQTITVIPKQTLSYSPTQFTGPVMSQVPQLYSPCLVDSAYPSMYVDMSPDVTPDYSEIPSPSLELIESPESYVTPGFTPTMPSIPPVRPYPPAACQCLILGASCNSSVAALSVVCQPFLPPLSQSYDCHWNCCLICIFNPSWSQCRTKPLRPICQYVLFGTPLP